MEIDRPHLELVEPMRIRQRLGDRRLGDLRRLGEPSRMPLRVPRGASHVPIPGVGHQQTATPLTGAARDVKRILFVDSNLDGVRAVQTALCQLADVDACAEFETARVRLRERPPDLLVTNIRLEAYNGLHLIHLTTGTPTRCIAYSEYHDIVLAREVQAAGAFYERLELLSLALPAYVNAVLPSRDRRDPSVLDRRRIPRGGRRFADLEQ